VDVERDPREGDELAGLGGLERVQDALLDRIDALDRDLEGLDQVADLDRQRATGDPGVGRLLGR
jgi:hypothetical protein